MIQWATVLFYFSVEEGLISSVFPSMGVQKPSMLGFSYFTEGALLIFALHPLTTVIESILKNEKYKGDASLQKTVTTDFLTHAHTHPAQSSFGKLSRNDTVDLYSLSSHRLKQWGQLGEILGGVRFPEGGASHWSV